MSKTIIVVGIVLIAVLLILKVRFSTKMSILILLILIISGALLGAALIYALMAFYNFTPAVGNTSSRTDDIIKISVPLLGSIITAFSVIIATYNTSNSEKSSKRQSILDLIKFTNGIISDDKVVTESERILKELESKLESADTKVDILVNSGARFVFEYLNTNNGENRGKILKALDRLMFVEGTEYANEQKELARLIKSDEIKDMRALWVTINHLSGKPALKYNILNEPKVYKLNDEWIGRSLKRHSFYSDIVLKKDRNILTDLIKENAKKDYSKELLAYDDIFRVFNDLFEANYEKLGHFFRTTHRTVKLINQYFSDDHDEYRQQIGLLRAQIPNSVSILLFYNAFYTEKGRGMGRELITSNFFGDRDDFKFNQSKDGKYSLIKSQHFQTRGMFLANQNTYIIHKLFSLNSQSLRLKREINKQVKQDDKSKFYKCIVKVLKYVTGIFLNNEVRRVSDEQIEGNLSKPELFILNKFRNCFSENSKTYGKDFLMYKIDNTN